MPNSEQSPQASPEEIKRQRKITKYLSFSSRHIGIAGLIMSILAWFTGWIPFVGWLIWFVGFLFSFFGLFKKPRGYAIAGIIISVIGIFILLFFFGLAIVKAS